MRYLTLAVAVALATAFVVSGCSDEKSKTENGQVKCCECGMKVDLAAASMKCPKCGTINPVAPALMCSSCGKPMVVDEDDDEVVCKSCKKTEEISDLKIKCSKCSNEFNLDTTKMICPKCAAKGVIPTP